MFATNVLKYSACNAFEIQDRFLFLLTKRLENSYANLTFDSKPAFCLASILSNSLLPNC